MRRPPPELEGILAGMFSAPVARNMMVCWQEIPEDIRELALAMVEAGGGASAHNASVSRDAQSSERSSLGAAVRPDGSQSATEPAHQLFPEDSSEAYVDEDTEMERILSRIYSGPDLEKALGRKPRLGLTSDKPYDCPVDPATGLLKKPPEPPAPPG